MDTRPSRGFTLIELLVVIAIVGILAAMIFPVFARVREKARQSSCQSNLHQVGLGALMYVQDYDERFPGVWDHTAGNNQVGGWTFYCCFPNTAPGNYNPSRGAVFPYLKNSQVYVCPSDAASAGCSYAFNSELAAVHGGRQYHIGLRLPRVRDAASTFTWLEESNAPGRSTDDGYFLAGLNHATKRHTDGALYAFIDGHVKWLRPSAVRFPNPNAGHRFEP